MSLLKKSLIAPGVALLLVSSLYATDNTFSIETSNLSEAIETISKKAKIPYIVDKNILKGKSANKIENIESLEEALKLVLKNTGLEAIIQNNSIVIREKKQSSSNESDLGSVEVIANKDQQNSYTIKNLSSATKMNLSLKDTPQSISVITSQQIEDQNLEDINDVLNQTPGISLRQLGQKSAGHTTYFARGMEITNVLRDGVPVSVSSFGTQSSMGLESSAMYERIEVTRGSTGLTNGSGNPSASINYVRKRPTQEFQGNAKASYGSWDNYKGQIDVSGSLNQSKSITGRLVASYSEGDNQQDRYHQDSSLFYGALDFNLSDNTLFTTAFSYQKVEADNVAVHHVTSIDKNGNEQSLFGREKNPAADWTYSDAEKTSILLGLEHYFNNDWKVITNYSYTKSKVDRLVGLSRTILNTDTGNIEGMALKAKNTPEVHALDMYAQGKFKAFGQEHQLSFGANGYQIKSDDPSYTVSPSLITAPYKNYDGDIPYPDIVENGRSKVDEKQIGAFVALNLQIMDPLKLIVGSRISNWERVNDKDQPSEETQKYHSEITPYVGLVYDINNNVSAYASYTSIFNPSSQQNEDGNYLDPEEGNTVEFGLKSEFYDGLLNTSLSYFITKQDNKAISDGTRLTPEGNQAYKSIDGAEIKGWDVTISGELLPDWNISGGYTYTDAKDENKERLSPGEIPKHTLKLFTSYQYNQLTIGAGLNWQSELNTVYTRYGLNKNIKQKAYTVVDAMLKYEIYNNLNLLLNINNMFDEEYRYYPGQGGYGDERNYALTLNYKF